MSFFWKSNSITESGPSRYNKEKDNIVTFNISGQNDFSYSILTLNNFKNSTLYKYAYEIPSSQLILDDNNNIYLDLCPTIFRHIHDYMKGYDLRIDDMTLKTKERIYKDAKLLNIDKLVREIELSLPKFTPETMNYWANIIAKSIIAMGVNIEAVYLSTTGKPLEYKISQKIRDLLEKNTNIRERVRKCVKYILESKCQNGSNVDKLILELLLEISKDLNPKSILEQFLAKLT